jgi:hypothetical protein
MSANGGALIGTWRLITCFMEDFETKDRTAFWGEHPNGRLVLTSAGHWLAIQTSENRPAPQTNDEQAAAFRSLLAYSGKYRIEGNKIIIKVDIAWDESWNGTEQIRYYRIDGEQLRIEAPPLPWAGKVMRGILVWTRDA